MRVWGRAPIVCFCGLCRHRIERGEPLLSITVPGLKRVLVRGSCCGEAPPDLPPLVERVEPEPIPLVHVASGLDALPLDFKSAAANDREPGMEG